MRALYLTWRDIAVFEKLADKQLDISLKRYLIAAYQKDGEIEQLANWQAKAASKCDQNCNECGYCQPFCQDPLLEQLLVICQSWELGIFDRYRDNYETARIKLMEFKEREQQLLPF
jgi:hypothetical protein